MKIAKKNHHFDFPDKEKWLPLHTPQIYRNSVTFFVLWASYQVFLYAVFAPIFLDPEDRKASNYREVLIYILIMLVGMLIHEFVHILCVPKSIFSQNIYLTFRLFMKCIPVICFYYDGILTRKRKLILLMTPFMIISVIPGIILYFSGISNKYLFVFIYLNACGCMNDIINTLILFRYPKDSLFFMSYWRKPAA